MKKLILILGFLGLAACAKSNGGSTTEPAVITPGSLKQVWRDPILDRQLDLTNFTAWQGQQMQFKYDSGEVCGCEMLAEVTQTDLSQVEYSLSQCSYTGGGAGDPGCAGIDSNGTLIYSSELMALKTMNTFESFEAVQ